MRVGQTGWVVDCTRPEPLASAITQLLSDDDRRRRMGHAARQWVEQTLDWTPLAAEAYSALGEDPSRLECRVPCGV
jgi:phosphatidylinositol alpha-1,6-mannosyltransferase